MAGSGYSSLHDYFDYQARVFRTLVIFKDPSLVRVQVYRCFRSVLRYCLTLLLKLDLQFELQSLLVPYYFVVCFLVGRWPYFDGALPGPVVLV